MPAVYLLHSEEPVAANCAPASKEHLPRHRRIREDKGSVCVSNTENWMAVEPMNQTRILGNNKGLLVLTCCEKDQVATGARGHEEAGHCFSQSNILAEVLGDRHTVQVQE